MTDAHDALARGKAAERALTEHLGPAFSVVQDLYAKRLQDVASSEPWAVDKIRSLALALKVVEAVRGQIEGVVAGGEMAEQQLARARKIEQMSPERRRILGLV